MSQFCSLHNHSYFSILRALPSPRDLLLRAKELGQPALALTDSGTFAGMWNAFKASKEIGVKLIAGAEFNFVSDISNKDEKIRHLILLAKNAKGYQNLLTLNKKGFDNRIVAGRRVIPVIDWNLLSEYSSGVICLTGCGAGIIAQLLNNKNFEVAENDLSHLASIFDRDHLGIEVQPHTLNRQATQYHSPINQIFTNYHLINLAKKFNLRIVPTSNTHYLKKEQSGTHDVLLSIGAMQPLYSNARLKYNTQDLYLKSYDEVKSFFARNYGDEFAYQICENTVYFADKCENPDWIDPKFTNPVGKELPEFPIKDEKDYLEFLSWLDIQPNEIKKLSSGSAYLRFKCYKSYNEKLKYKLIPDKRLEYTARIEKELSVLHKQGFSDYMLIVADYVKWAENNNIARGPGRGSVGSTIIGYLLDIHKADPIKYNLIFERFQNIEKKSAPDIDCDFSTEGRQKVIDYIVQKYGADKTAYVSNLNRLKPKMFVRDIARAHQFGGSSKEAVRKGNSIAEIIPANLKDSTDFGALKTTPLFATWVKEHSELEKNKEILGKIRNLSSHAGAQIIGRRSLVGLVPLRKDKDGNQSLEYDKDDAEENGLLKMDILGLSTLDLIEEVIKLINIKETKISLDKINFEEYDKKTYDLISSGDTYGVFQFGTSSGTIDLCKKIKPKSIDDLAIITTLARPAAADIREEFIKVRSGKKTYEPIHPSLNNAFKNTYGFGLYDESILQLGSDVAGWSLNESDRLRKMIKEKGKNPEKDKKLEKDFIQGAINNGIEPQMAERIWKEQLGKFSGYTFNRSHAVLYSFISFITAYFKAHYPVEFLLANLIAEVKSNAPDAIVNRDRAKIELRSRGVNILPPDINKSDMDYKLLDSKTLLTGLDALKFVGEDAIKDILQKRPFKDFHDFIYKTETRAVRSSAIQALAASGCLDSFGIPRKLIFLYCADYRKKLQVWLKKHDPKVEHFDFPWTDEKEWSKPELYALEKHYLGEAFVCSKKEAFVNFFDDDREINLAQVKTAKNRQQFHSLKAEIKDIFILKVKKNGSKFLGQEMAKVLIEDQNGFQCSLTIFPDRWQIIKKKLENKKYKFDVGCGIYFSASCNIYENERGLILDEVYSSCMPPSLPKDLKSKKISFKSKQAKSSSGDDLIDELEADLINAGMVDLNEDPFEVDI